MKSLLDNDILEIEFNVRTLFSPQP